MRQYSRRAVKHYFVR